VESLDALVVGAGVGGLACAVAIARTGRRVEVVEAQPEPGGYATGFERDGYRFDASLHLLDGVEPGGSNRPVWEALGLHRHLSTSAPPLLRREIWPEHVIDVPQGLDGWVDVMSTAFPHCRRGFVEVARIAEQVLEAAHADRDARIWGTPSQPLAPVLSSLMDRTAEQVLLEHLSDPRARAITGTLSCYLGLGCDELAAIPFLTMFASYQRDGGTYPAGGSAAISAALVAELRSHGGQLRTNSPIATIRTRQRAAIGVTLTNGDQIDSDVVVSNVSPIQTYGGLLDVDLVGSRFRRKLDAMTLGTSMVKVWLGLDDPLPQAAYETFLRAAYSTRFRSGSLDDLGVVATHHLDPTCCPEGHGVLSITVGVEAHDPAPAGLADALVSEVERRLLRSLSGAIQTRVVATPATFERFTGNPGGTIHGFRPIPRQSGPRRLGATGPIARLLQVGSWTYAGSGVLPSMTSGLVAAATIDRWLS
jgi:prolycopene isomerase